MAACAAIPALSAPSAVAASSSPKAVPGELLVRFEAGTTRTQRADIVAEHDGRIVGTVPALRVAAVKFSELKGQVNTTQARSKERALERERRVAVAEPNYLYRASVRPNDPGLAEQWAWDTIKTFDAWDVTQGDPSTSIAVIDTGIQRTHPDLDAKIVAGHDYVDGDDSPDDGNGHGTHVSGTAAAETDNATGAAGTCPKCSVMPVRVLDENGSGSLLDVAEGIIWAADHGAKVVNMSLGGPGTSTLEDAVNYATGKGVFLSCAAGNDNTSDTTNAYPAAYEGCFGVASTTSADARSSFSNYGSWVEAAAPGSDIYSTWNDGAYNTISGTSMATPHVAGLAGLLASQGLAASDIRERICRTADPIAGTGSDWTCGRINVASAVTDTAPPPPPANDTIVNGGFEDGLEPWTQASGSLTLPIGQALAHAGLFGAWLGGYNNGTDTVSQTVSVPANGTLAYWWYMTTQESGSTPFDYLRVRLYDAGGAVVATPSELTNASGAGQWRQASVNLADHAGETLRIEFSAITDSTLLTSFHVDDVSLK